MSKIVTILSLMYFFSSNSFAIIYYKETENAKGELYHLQNDTPIKTFHFDENDKTKYLKFSFAPNLGPKNMDIKECNIEIESIHEFGFSSVKEFLEIADVNYVEGVKSRQIISLVYSNPADDSDGKKVPICKLEEVSFR